MFKGSHILRSLLLEMLDRSKVGEFPFPKMSTNYASNVQVAD